MRIAALMTLATVAGLWLGVCAQAQQPSPEAHVAIRVDLRDRAEPYTPVFNWFGYDELNYTTAPHGRQLLRELHDLSHAACLD